jgi:hypothetical protein
MMKLLNLNRTNFIISVLNRTGKWIKIRMRIKWLIYNWRNVGYVKGSLIQIHMISMWGYVRKYFLIKENNLVVKSKEVNLKIND